MIRGNHWGPAKWAIDVGFKPRVNAGDMEGVITLGQDSQLFPSFKLRQAHRAIGALYCTGILLGVLDHRDSVDQ